MKKYIAEFVGTFALAGIVALSVSGSFVLSTPILAGLTLGLFVYTVGHISGTHINPAVTIGIWSIKKISTIDAAYYIVAQLLGGLLAFVLARLIHPGFAGVGGVSTPEFIAELVGTFFFTFGIASVLNGKVPSVFSGMVGGGSLLLGISFAALMGSVGALNPAVALALGAFNPVYIIAPIVGSVLGFQVYRWLGV